MTVFLNNSFAEGDYSAWSSTTVGEGQTLEISEAWSHHDTYSSHCAVTDWSWLKAYCTHTLAEAQGTLNLRVYAKFVSLAAGNQILEIELVNSKTLHLRVGDGNKYRIVSQGLDANIDTTTDTDIPTGTLQIIELHYKKGAGTGEASLTVNGAEIYNTTNNNFGDYNAVGVNVGLYNLGTPAMEAYYDCVVVADAEIGVESSGQQLFTLINMMGY